MDYAKALKIARAISGLQQKELAVLAGVDPSHISLIESGKRTPSVHLLERVSSALDIPDHLLTLLAGEPADIDARDPEAISQVAESLARLIIRDARAPSQNRRGRRRSR